MSTSYKFGDSEYAHFITFAVVNWIDAPSRPAYKDIVVESVKYCQKEKGLKLHSWVIMSNHVHLIASAEHGVMLRDIIRDLKKYTSKQPWQAIRQNTFESRRDWMLWIACPEHRDLKEKANATATTKTFSFGNRIIIHLSFMVTRC